MKETDDEKRLGNARIGYQVAASLWVYEGNLIWAKFNALLLAHSIILAGTGLSMTSQYPVVLLNKALPVAGFALCVLWGLLVKRGFDNYVYWVWTTRELEEQHLADPVKTTSRGGVYADGKEAVTIVVGGERKELKMPWISGLLKAEYASYFVILVFAALYVLLAFHNWGYGPTAPRQ
jgi:hypothetical protein